MPVNPALRDHLLGLVRKLFPNPSAYRQLPLADFLEQLLTKETLNIAATGDPRQLGVIVKYLLASLLR